MNHKTSSSSGRDTVYLLLQRFFGLLAPLTYQAMVIRSPRCSPSPSFTCCRPQPIMCSPKACKSQFPSSSFSVGLICKRNVLTKETHSPKVGPRLRDCNLASPRNSALPSRDRPDVPRSTATWGLMGKFASHQQ